MIPAHYFRFVEPRYELKIGALPLASPDLVFERDDEYEKELALKRACMDYDAHYYCQELAGSEEAQREVLAMTGADGEFAIRAAGDAVQEDLLILDCGQAGLPLIAGHLCFANAWCLDDKMGRSFMEIHGPVPEFPTTIGPSSEKLLERLKVGRPVGRLNWAVKSTGQLDLTSRWDGKVAEWNREVDARNAGERWAGAWRGWRAERSRYRSGRPRSRSWRWCGSRGSGYLQGRNRAPWIAPCRLARTRQS